MRPFSILLIGVALLLLAAAPAAGVVAIAYLGFPGEVVTILNTGPEPVDMTGWTLTDERTANTYTFPSFTLASGKIVTVYAGRGTDSATHLYWSGGRDRAAVWNSDGDVVTLRNTSGTRIADSRGFVLGVPTLPTLVRTPVTTMPLVTAVALPGYPPVSPMPTPYLTTAPAGVPSDGPIIVPPYPTTIRTLAPGQTTLPVPIQQPQWALPTGTPRPVLLPTVAPAVRPLPGGRRYAIGNPGSLLGARFGTGGATTPTGTVRAVPTTGHAPGPGTVSFGVTPPPRGSFVRWYPAARWAAGLR